MTPRPKLSALQFGYIALWCAVMSFSFQNDFTYFVDSQTYLTSEHRFGILWLGVYLFPYSVVSIAIFNLFISLEILKAARRRWLAALVIINPYTLLLLTNLTKEQLIFAAIAMNFVLIRGYKAPRIIQPILIVAIASVRPIYAALLFLSPRSLRNWNIVLITVSAVIGIGILFASGSKNTAAFYSELSGFIESRAHVEHIGRDFFNYLCVPEKLSAFDYFGCATLTFFGFPLHDDLYSLNYFVFFIHTLATSICIRYFTFQ